jgi:hypothetical protein
MAGEISGIWDLITVCELGRDVRSDSLRHGFGRILPAVYS